jgi:predicted nuclease of predicted toxin-antitoxin system
MNLEFLADMNISPITVDLINSAGYLMSRVSERLSSSSLDAEILSYSRKNNLILVTQDLDFSNLIALGNYRQPSFITFRIANNSPAELAAMFGKIMKHESIVESLYSGSSITVTDKGIRIRQLPINK